MSQRAQISLLLFLLFQSYFCQSQTLKDIKLPEKSLDKKCYGCLNLFQNKTPDIQFGIHNINDELYFLINDENWLDQLLTNANDGFAVDIISKNQYSCDSKKTFKNTDYIRGTALSPIFKKEIDKIKQYTSTGILMIKLGDVPNFLLNQEKEYNLIILKNKNYCLYHRFYEIPGHKWELLETGLFADSITNMNDIDKSIVMNKKFEFEIKFDKNKYQYYEKDIRPIYDSLQLYNYNIKSLEIEAYSSLEGDLQNNKFLQRQRANSIISALKKFQNDSISASITTSENWVDFFNDIVNTKYSNWATLNKSTIKNKLKNEKVLNELEPLLAKHRKAVLYLELEKRYSFDYKDMDQIVKLFNQAINKKDLNEASKIQASAYHYVKNEKLPTELMDKLEVPLSSEFGILYNNKIVYNYALAPQYIYSALAEFRKLNEILPDNTQILYNINALTLKAWSYNDPLVDKDNLSQSIKYLRKLGLETALVERLDINYNIILSEELQIKHLYKQKDECLREIYNSYRKINISSSDALSIAKYFVSYQKFEWAIALLKPYVIDIHAPEELLFYYINLTIINEKTVGQASYRTLLLNAINKNTIRFCTLFNPSDSGGVTFQLLDNLFLRKNYCENCEIDNIKN